MVRERVIGVNLLEEKHLISILTFLSSNGPSRKIDLYERVSENPRMPEKLNLLEEMGLITQVMDIVSRSTIVGLTEAGEQVACMLISADNTIKSLNLPRVP